MNRLSVALLATLSIVAFACGGSSPLDNTQAAVRLTVDVTLYNPEVDICGTAGMDVSIATMTVNSTAKSPDVPIGDAQDVRITRWVVTPQRTDGGSIASPVWTHDETVFVSSGGSANLGNYPIFPAEYFDIDPLIYLKPENGGFDPVTGNRNIRQSLTLQMFGRTIGGKAVSTEPIPIAFNFKCGS
jgi:hypothetical protein